MAATFAVRAFADSLRLEEPSLRVTSVHPGRIATGVQRQLVQFEGGRAAGDGCPCDGHVHEIVNRQR